MNVEGYKEVWKDIPLPEFEGKYQISNKCRVRTTEKFKGKTKYYTHKFLGGTIHKNTKHHQITLMKGDVQKTFLVIDLYKMCFNGD